MILEHTIGPRHWRIEKVPDLGGKHLFQLKSRLKDSEEWSLVEVFHSLEKAIVAVQYPRDHLRPHYHCDVEPTAYSIDKWKRLKE